MIYDKLAPIVTGAYADVAGAITCYTCVSVLHGDCLDAYGKPAEHLEQCANGVNGCRKTKLESSDYQLSERLKIYQFNILPVLTSNLLYWDIPHTYKL